MHMELYIHIIQVVWLNKLKLKWAKSFKTATLLNFYLRWEIINKINAQIKVFLKLFLLDLLYY